MKREFIIEFKAKESNIYNVTVSADTEEEALKFFNERLEDYEWQHCDSAEEPVDISDIKIKGEWIGSSFKPIKSKL